MGGKMRIYSENSNISNFGPDIKCNVAKTSRKEDDRDEEDGEGFSKIQYPTVSFFQLYKYADTIDKISLCVATFFCIVTSVFNSMLSMTLGDMTGAVVDYVNVTSLDVTDAQKLAARETLEYEMVFFLATALAMGVATMILTYLSTLMFNYAALRQTYRIRSLFFASVLNQDIPWFDINQTGDFTSRVAGDLKKIEEAIGEKVSTFLFYEAIFVSSIMQALILGWELALVCMISFPLATAAMIFISWISSKLSKQEMEAYGAAGAIAEETLTAIRTVVAFGGQHKEEQRYHECLMEARSHNTKRALFNGISNGLLWFFSYASYAIAFWYGVKLIIEERQCEDCETVTYDAGKLVAVFFSVLTGTWYFSMASPFIEMFGEAKGAASKIFGIIESRPHINESKGQGGKIEELVGAIQFRDIHFHYPSRPDVKILRGLNLDIRPGETVALVGSSGCGKSTCIQLLQRYYDPLQGMVSLDGQDLRTLDLTWLRSKVGVVGQEPVLFEATIAENIRFGKPDASDEEVLAAAKKANAHVFVSKLPQSYNTPIGERGAQLSGGQKQRIAIARALVKKPAILLLDEATSALDTKSEAVVQAALDTASNECTTVIVAHRLSTIRNADRIVVIHEGRVQEKGTHEELCARQGAYWQMIKSQGTVDEDAVGDGESEGEDELEDIASTTTDHHKVALQLVRQDSVETGGRNSLDLIAPQLTLEAVAKKQAEENQEHEQESGSALFNIIAMNRPEWWIIVIGCISSTIAGAGIPISAAIFGEIVKILAGEDDETLRKETDVLSLYFLYIGIGVGLGMFLQVYMFGIAGERLSMRLRKYMFHSILSQEMAWFDNSDNGVGALCARLAGDAASVQGATGQRIGTILNALSTVIFAVVISFYYEWRVAAVGMVFAPMIVMGAFLEERFISKESDGTQAALQRSSKIAVEGIGNIRTVASLNSEEIFHKRYMDELIPFQNIAKKNTHLRGVVFGFSRSTMFFAYGAALYYGSALVIDKKTDHHTIFTVSEALVTSSWAIANALAFSPNFQKGVAATKRIYRLISRVPLIRGGSGSEWTTGNVKYENVHFVYPTRPTVPVLRGLNLEVLQDKMVALVGPSGCGKSTIVQLLERFYDPLRGAVTVDSGTDTRSLHLSFLRSQLGIVSQEPNLFSKTIGENIAYGDNSRTVTAEEIKSAAKQANIHNFIVSLPLGYETKLGDKGTQLSGGQKQRVAIARALIRNPKVLLLDEATSALDSESEKIVQEALDNAKVGRTCISIAHRLVTIQDADVICVINHGKVAEMGTHSELLKQRGLYYNLYTLQSGAS